jgi:hypothetical protein
VAPSTPVQDFRLHVQAWQHHFAAIFGLGALERVRGFRRRRWRCPTTRHGLRIRQDPQGLRLPVGARAGAHRRAPEDGQGFGAQAPPASPGRAAIQRARRRHHRHHQDPGQRHQAGGADAALLRGQVGWSAGNSPASRSRPGDPDRRRRERRRDDERVPAQVSGGHARGQRLRGAAAQRERVSGLPRIHRPHRGGLFPAIQPIFQHRLWQRYQAGSGPEKLPRSSPS